MHRTVWLALGLMSIMPLVSARGAERPVDFSREVLPILSDHCFHCHGPDAKSRQGNLRLDTREGAFAAKRDRKTLVPGKPAESELIRRMESKDTEEMMPPPEAHRPLKPVQVATLKRWVAEGAKWGQHWALVPVPEVVPVPAGPSPVDAFIDQALVGSGLQKSPRATAAQWLRRVTFDLTGLPPTIDELKAFGGNPSRVDYAAAVDRLLKSPRYAERMATEWLDLARYADTHGYQSDRYRPTWAYRDWVLRAFQKNQRYDEFARDQLAGDMLPKPTQETRLATAFNRLHMQNEEGGIVEEEFRVAYVADRVATFGTAFLAQTFDCCRCHDHKYDPISQKEYYQLFAFFQNIDEAGQTTYFTDSTPVPTLLLSTPEQDQQLATLSEQV
ncbi:MAG: DUF1549 domain-containing protein, partial [Gemmataceae bacterium]